MPRISYRVPVDADDVLQNADANLEYRTQSKDGECARARGVSFANGC